MDCLSICFSCLFVGFVYDFLIACLFVCLLTILVGVFFFFLQETETPQKKQNEKGLLACFTNLWLMQRQQDVNLDSAKQQKLKKSDFWTCLSFVCDRSLARYPYE